MVVSIALFTKFKLMKQFITLCIILLFTPMTQAQQNDNSYSELWKEVQIFENEALTKSALQVVQGISEKARKEENTAQIVKALIYTSKYALILEEDAQLKIINDFKAEIENSTFPTKNILESYLANLYWQYFQQNRYRFYNRTKTETKVDLNDFRTWDLTTLFSEIRLHFDRSLENTAGLQKENLQKFLLILDEQKNSKNIRPSLYDLLSHTALQFYKTNENSITRPAYKFEINDSDLLCEANSYVSLNINSQDETSLQLDALQLFQKLIQFHLPKAPSSAFVHVDLERLQFIYQNATFENKEQYYLDALENSSARFKDHAIAALYSYEIASVLHQNGNAYQPKTAPENQWKHKEALDLCEEIIKKYPNSLGAEKCKALKTTILSRNIQIQTEQYLPVNAAAKVLVTHKNHKELQLTAYRITQSELKKLGEVYQQEKKLAFIQELVVERRWETMLKNEGDYQNHTTEVLVPSLKNGGYIILATPKDTASDNGTFAYAHVYVTDLVLVENQTRGEHFFQVIDRNTGTPKVGASLKFTYKTDYRGSYKSKTLTSNKDGIVRPVTGTQNWRDVSVHIKHKDDVAYFGQYYVYQKNRNSNSYKTNYAAFLFTDRSIYRPGQPIYFKGIAIERNQNQTAVKEDISVIVSMHDVNGQEVGTQNFVTNEFGSFTGEFIIPNSGLTGNFSLRVNSQTVALNGYSNFSVEEYKRPKFETSFEAVTETYKVNDSVTIKGTAMAYAGSAITDAKVNYRVQRVVYYPRWYYWYRPYFNSTPQELSNGEVITDASGKYEITFKAQPDLSASKENLPVFSYQITADVTDINGETHSTSTVVSVGYHALTANIYIPDLIDKDKKENSFSISTSNLNGQFVPAKGVLKIYKLEAPKQVVRTRPWEAPDYKSFTKSKFHELFPYEAYENEDNASLWKKGEMVWKGNFDTENSKEVFLKNLKKWTSGKYAITLETKDKFGQEVKDEARFALFSPKDQKLADQQLFQIKTDKSSYMPGDEVILTLASAAKNIAVTVLVEKDQRIVDTQIIHLKNSSKRISIPVTKNDIGGFVIHYSFAAFNTFKGSSIGVTIPYPSTSLEIETTTFRDKLKPGTDEEWSFKIKGPKGDKVAAELLASMYDTSLDTFRGHSWGFNPIYQPYYYASGTANAYRSFGITSFSAYNPNPSYSYRAQYYDTFNWFGLYFGQATAYGGRRRMMKSAAVGSVSADDMDMELNEVAVAGLASAPEGAPRDELRNKEDSTAQQKPVEQAEEKDVTSENETVQIRKNLQETAFFFPQLKTDEEGNVSFSFTTPEALTKWRLQLLAHTKTLETTTMSMEAVTQKELMVIPNAPRFLREGDLITISTKIANLTEKSLTGTAELQLIDAVTGKNIDAALDNSDHQKSFEVAAKGNTQTSWSLKIPNGIQAVQYTVVAKTSDFSDGEQNLLPVLSNRMLVTETMPMWVRSNQKKTFVLEKLRDNTSKSLKHHKLSLEITSNPAWYAVQALPYLMEYPYDCNEQTFSRYYANTLASHIANSNPSIREVFDQWAHTDALLSNLEKNQELKSLLIQETPWLRDAQSETEQKKRIALLFNLNKMKNEQANALNKLRNNQYPSGGWPWFKGGRENRFVTQHIITGLGHLKQLKVAFPKDGTQQMIEKGIQYLDAEFVKEYEYMKKHASNLNEDHLSYTQLHYLYMRSFFPEIVASKKVKEITGYYKGQSQKYWTSRSLYAKGLLALSLYRMEDEKTAGKILKSLKQNSITSEELGMYWKENSNSWYWYQAPIETQALLIEAFSEIENDITTIDNLKIWLLKNKQTNQWKTTKATTEAVYALLLQGSDWLSVTDAVEVLIGGEKIDPSKLENVKVEAGTGYYKTAWNGSEVTSKMSEVSIRKNGNGIAWGALYWQYFEDLDKISSAETPLKLQKKLFLKKNTDVGEAISEITEKTTLKVGDLVRVRIELRVDRAMEFVHMKDMRASGLEPLNVISRYKWQDGLGYYESTKDASTNFFFDYLPKGVFVFEYDLRVNNAGNFSNGITTIQSMYAPEFSSHSEGVRIAIEQ